MLVVIAIAAGLAVLPFAALVVAARARRERILDAWQGREEERASRVFRVRAALDPAVPHTIWIGDGHQRGRTLLPPLRDERGRPVELAPGDCLFRPQPHELEVTKSDYGPFDGKEIFEQIVRIAGDAELFVQARVVDREAVLALAPARGRYYFGTSPDGFSSTPAALPRPVVPLRLPVLAVVALATTVPMAMAARFFEAPLWLSPCPFAVLGVTARAHEIVFGIEQWLRPGDFIE